MSSVDTNEYKWAIPHPGTGEWVYCESFEECMEKWFEGFNIPRKVYAEPFSESLKRVKKRHSNDN